MNGVLQRPSFAEHLPRIQAPTLVVVGDEDVATTPEKAARLAAGIPHARLVTIPGAGHTSTIEQPAAVTTALREFLVDVAI